MAIADMSAVLHAISSLIYSVQTDHAGAQAYTYLYLFRTFVLYVYQQVWWVANVDVKSNVDDVNHWNGNTKFPDHDYIGVLLGVAADCLKFQGGDSLITMIPKKLEDMDLVSTELQVRLRDNLVCYGAKPTTDRLLEILASLLVASSKLSLQG
jgi:hypothetical protein